MTVYVCILWEQILCRTPLMQEDIYNMLVQKAVDEGYDVTKLHKTPQADPPPEDEHIPKDRAGFWWIKSIFGR